MARYRSIKPSYWSDAKVCRLSIEAQLLFIGIWNFADDQGLLWDDPDQIQMDVFPSRPHIKVQALVDELLLSGMIRTLDTTMGRPVLHVVNFAAHQRIDHPTKSVISPSLVSPLDSSCGLSPEGKGREGNREEGSRGEDSKTRARDDDDPEFTSFWQQYPSRKGRKVGKPEAIAEWVKLTEPERVKALIGVENYRIDCDRGTYPKDACRWLKGKCWADFQDRVADTGMTTTNGNGHHPGRSQNQINADAVARRMGYNPADTDPFGTAPDEPWRTL